MTEKKVKRDGRGRWAKGKKGGPGRPKKHRGTGKPFHDFLQAFEALGGLEGLIVWARQNNSNRSQFYSLLMRTVPQKVIEQLLMPQHQDESPLRIEYVSVDLERQRLRIQQLEEFIRKQGAVVPEPAEIRQSGADTGEDGK
ncbi:hypothetical protein ES707_06706 [subsurface metagenome]